MSHQNYKILFVGSNPSIASGNPRVAFFLDTKSTTTLYDWLSHLQSEHVYVFTNVVKVPTENNRPLKISEIKAALPSLAREIERTAPDRIIALGKTANKALTLLQLQYLEMPHPSGLNRKLNNKEFKELKIKELVDYCEPTSP